MPPILKMKPTNRISCRITEKGNILKLIKIAITPFLRTVHLYVVKTFTPIVWVELLCFNSIGRMKTSEEKPEKEVFPFKNNNNNKDDLESLLPKPTIYEKVTNWTKTHVTPSVIKTSLSICGWYVLNVIYVIENKNSLNALPLPWSISALQLCVGWFFALFFWGTGIRKIPKFVSTKIFFMTIVPQGVCHLFVHLGAVISMGVGAVSFTHVVKAGEPVITAGLSILILREFMNIGAYISLIPIVCGVALASAKELHFSQTAFWFAIISNIGSSSRSILAKLTMKNKQDIGEELTASNIYMLLILVSSIFSIPIALAIEWSEYSPVWRKATLNATNGECFLLIFRAILSGVCYYMCNDFAFICLGELNQVSHSVVNTLKRVVLITSSIIFFNYPITVLGVLGMTIAILGTFFYAIFK
ncbi:Sugar phosphate transporter domain [Babesia duncani]|uniref:Sugar phosphate transporter domain n=1 Tax=Babesia duncani TaxID=323732 RepID=A0AAD9PJQ2_9APIC|nr:Sugar phosphate transporter domain [Babesia duncani]